MEDRSDPDPGPDAERVRGATLASELRVTTAAADVRADAEEAERLALRASLRRRDLADVARDLMARGDRVAIDVAGRRLVGVVVHAAGDLVSLEGEAGRVDVALGHVRRLGVVAPDATAGRDAVEGPRSFKARLYELELDEPTVVLALADGAELTGRLRAVAVDHVLLTDLDGHEWAVRLDHVAHVAARTASVV